MAQRRIAIIGSGFSGLCLRIQLKKAGIDAFTIFEKSDRPGGTWRDNTYPGAACAVPAIRGLDRFRGACFHSARWDHGADLAGKRVGVIGNAASAIQLIPQIAPRVRHLSIFQRSANWMLPRGDRAYTERERRWLARLPLLARLHRWSIWLRLRLPLPLMRGHRFCALVARAGGGEEPAAA